MLVRFQSGSASTTVGAAAAGRKRRAASQKISVMSTIAAPMIMPSAIRNVILRNGSPSWSQPIDTKYGTSAQPSSPPTIAGMPMRAPTTMPAPKVEVERSMAPSHATLIAAMPPASPSAMPVPSLPTDCAAAPDRSARAGCWRPQVPTGR